MSKSFFEAPIDLNKHLSLIYAEGVFGLKARQKLPMRAKTADGILRYAEYKIAGVVDSSSREKTASEVLPVYLPAPYRSEATGSGSDISSRLQRRGETSIFSDIKSAKQKTQADVLIIGTAPEGGELPEEYARDIIWAVKNKMHIVSGMHYALIDDTRFAGPAKKHKVILWDTRKAPNTKNIPLGSAKAYHVKKPIVLTVGLDAAIGKMTVGYEMHRAAQKLGAKSCIIPTGQTAMMIEGWGITIDALPADFMSGAVEEMVCEKARTNDILFVEGQGSLFHPAYANTCISLIHGAVPTHMILTVRPQRKHSIGSKLIKLPNINRAIEQYEKSVLPPYRNSKIVAVAINSEGLSRAESERHKANISRQYRLPVFDALRDQDTILEIVKKILKK